MADTIAVKVNGSWLRVPPGTSVAAAVLLAGETHFRTSVTGEPRGPLCGMGICFECKATVDERQAVRTCQTLVREGMVIRTSC